MRKLYEIFKVLKVQKRIVSAETLRGNTVAQISLSPLTFFLSLVLQTYAVPLLMQKLQCVAWQKRKTLCVCLSSPTALTLQNRTRQSLASKKVTFKKLRAFYSLMRQLNFFLAVQLGVCSWHFNLSMYYLCHKIV